MGKIVIEIGKYVEAEQIVRLGLLRKAYRMAAKPDPKGKSLDYTLVERADGLTDRDVGTRLDLKNGVMIERGYRELIVFNEERIAETEELEFPGSCVVERLCLQISGEIQEVAGYLRRGGDNLQVVIDFDATSPPYTIRGAREGDRVKLLNAPGNRKLSDIFIDRKIPRSLRSEIPVLTAADAIVWVVGIGIADDVRVGDQTRTVLKLTARPSVLIEGDGREAGDTD
jgi:tRNA(Ile)-lysidine synthase